MMMGKSSVSDKLQRAGPGESRCAGETGKITPELRPESQKGFSKSCLAIKNCRSSPLKIQSEKQSFVFFQLGGTTGN